ncbi:murein L,D-transpeptidase [Shewanella sp.]|uniref:L,D-transpeptidase family protein n=1 Tax=Shewanella sp. TaxID=50422 RepID=UPI0035689D1D
MKRLLIVFLLMLLSPLLSAGEAEYSRQLMREQASLFILAQQDKASPLLPLMQSFELTEDALERDYQTLKAEWLRYGIEPGNASGSSLSSRLIALEPNSQYLALMNEIRQLLWQEGANWQVIEIEGVLRPGNNHKTVPLLAHKLTLSGDLSGASVSSATYQGQLVEAVKRFQRRHGLKDDGAVGEKTLHWLNLHPREKAQMLTRNYLLQSAEFLAMPSSMVLVNIPAFELTLYNDGKQVLQSRVIVGKPSRKTPVLESEISAVVVNPSWRVPRRLVRYDVLPKLREDAHYLSSKGFIVWDRQGQMINETDEFYQQAAHGKFPYLLEQRPGPENALGRFKLFFANDDSVYLHDTPDKGLFKKSMRALSSGCVRVEKIAELANWLARERVTDPRLWQSSVNTPERTQWFRLETRLPVRFVYWTSWIDNNGKAQFRDDVYDIRKDNQLVAQRTP